MRERAPSVQLQPALPSTLVFLHERAEVELHDPSFERIVAMVERGEYHAAAVASQDRWLAGSYDVRVLGYFLYGVHLAQGTAALPTIFEGARDFLGHWDLLGPEERKAQHADSTLHWLVRRLERELEPTTPANEAERAVLRRARGCIPALVETIEQVTDSRRCLERLHHIAHVLDDLARVPLDELPIAPPEDHEDVAAARPPEPAGDELSPPETGGAEEPAAHAADPAPPATQAPAAATTLTLPLSAPFALLLRKLMGFQLLVERQDFQRAAVLALDVQEALDRFDPRAYFPQLLAPFFRTLAATSTALEPWIHDAEGVTTRALAQHCQVDLEGFLEP